ncbi:endolytic transglycosylase MltG, partial [Sinomonas atrocyanea]|uniref:endolytic transglycosylase MltG n=1 Tax=Sinomonas atrocyanea TaxID=37927 RepID=UPI0027857166
MTIPRRPGRPPAADPVPAGGGEAITAGPGAPETPVSAPAAQRPPARHPLRTAAIAMGVVIALTVAGSILLGLGLRAALKMDKVTDYPGPGTGQVQVTVQPGAGPLTVAQELQQDGVIADPETFVRALSGAGGKISPGDYTFKKEMKASDAAAILAGTDSAKVVYFALSAGMRVGDSLDAIAKAASVDRKDLDALNAKPGDFGLPAKAKSLEGYLAPGEYRFPVGTSAKDILAKLVSTTVDELKQ